MCGICGILNFNSEDPVNKDLLQEMCNVVCHRGPDEEGVYLGFRVGGSGYRVGLGHRRLAIIDLATGRQPIHNEDETVWIVFNGEIYNFRELRDELEKKGHRFYTQSDTEIIVHLYEDEGRDCVNRLNGMFSFAIWDDKEKRLFLARDRLGIKPLFYYLSEKKLVFSSEIKSILADKNIVREVDIAALYNYLSYQYVPYPQTIFKGIKRLSPGHTLNYANGKISVSKYWDLNYKTKVGLNKKECIERINELLTDSVRLRLVSDVPLGAFLSGGIDSSTVVGLMAKLIDQPVKTFSMGFREESFNELRYARTVSNRFNTDHREFIVRPPDIVELLPKLIRHFDEPFGDPSAIPTYIISELARKEVTVCLSGDGGDELFAGYQRYLANRLAKLYSIIPRFLREGVIKKVVERLPESTNRGDFVLKLKRFTRYSSLPPGKGYAHLMMIFDDGMKERLCSRRLWDEIVEFDSSVKLLRYFESAKADEFLDRILYTDTKTYLPGDLLRKVDIMSMANSLEVRVPFLDHRLVEFVASIPPGFKLAWFTTKYILKEAVKDLLPRQIICREKHGFGVPIGNWFKNQLQGYMKEILLDARTLKRGYFNQEYISWMLRQHLSARRDFSHPIWLLLVFELWHRMYIDG